MSTLIIVESPTKAKTITKFLGTGYVVRSSFGHVRDLPKSKMGIDVKHNFKPQYVIPVKAKKVIDELTEIMKKTDDVILATDEDREGEAIAWHLAAALGLEQRAEGSGSKKKSLSPAPSTLSPKRIVFHE